MINVYRYFLAILGISVFIQAPSFAGGTISINGTTVSVGIIRGVNVSAGGAKVSVGMRGVDVSAGGAKVSAGMRGVDVSAGGAKVSAGMREVNVSAGGAKVSAGMRGVDVSAGGTRTSTGFRGVNVSTNARDSHQGNASDRMDNSSLEEDWLQLKAGLLLLAESHYLDKGCLITSKEALKYFSRAADRGSVTALNALGRIYEEHEKDFLKALYFYGLAVAKGDSAGLNNMGHIYQYHLVDYAKALEYYRLAADEGDARAYKHLGDMYRDGQGVPADRNAARRFYRRTIRLGDDEARSDLEALNL